ncbi:hypothetical protein CC79DRAFT_1371736 [Sarocladium strictum]
MHPILPLLTTLFALAPPITAHSGSLTYFHPGLGACGYQNTDNDPLVAISAALYDRTNSCGRWIKVKGPKGTRNVKVRDRCEGCAEWDLDLGPKMFKEVVGDLGIGRAKGTWEWA